MLWGGLRPIPSRLLVDVATLSSLFYCAATPTDDVVNLAVLMAACLATLFTAGPTCRWTISFPLVPFLLLQMLRRAEWSYYATLFVGVVSVLLVLLSAALTVLFPAVELGKIRGKYNVGLVDLHLPVDFTEGARRGSLLGTQHQDSMEEPSDAYVTARLLYPTDEEPERLPYLDPNSAEVLCSELMKAGAPPPLKGFGWMLHTWRFTTISAKRNARPLESSEPDGGLPMAVYSHGLTGIAAIYSYQALNLAANGTAVLMIDHTDESAVASLRRNSSFLLYDPSLVKGLINKEMDEEEYERRRKGQAEHRVEECLSALEAFTRLNKRNTPELDSVGVSFVGRLDTKDVTMMGHSFGGATALASAARRPDLVSAVVAHEPAVAWMPDASREALLPPEADGTKGQTNGDGDEEEKKDSSGDDRDGGNLFSSLMKVFAKEEDEEKTKDSAEDIRDEGGAKSLHDVDMLFLYSEEWSLKNWGAYERVKTSHQQRKLGPKDGNSDVGVISGSNHQEFSDTCVLTPVWLARATGLTGRRDPHDTAEEIAVRTADFLDAVRSRRRSGIEQ